MCVVFGIVFGSKMAYNENMQQSKDFTCPIFRSQRQRKKKHKNDPENLHFYKVKEIEWLWYPYIPYGKITVVQGDAGDGKSTFVLNLAAMLSRGQPMPFTDGPGQPPINIIYQSSEDDADDTIVPRFLSAGGDQDRLLFISEKERYLSFSDDRLLRAIRQTGARVVVMDPLSAYIGEDTGINAANEVRRQFRPLIEIAREQRCAILDKKLSIRLSALLIS